MSHLLSNWVFFSFFLPKNREVSLFLDSCGHLEQKGISSSHPHHVLEARVALPAPAETPVGPQKRVLVSSEVTHLPWLRPAVAAPASRLGGQPRVLPTRFVHVEVTHGKKGLCSMALPRPENMKAYPENIAKCSGG